MQDLSTISALELLRQEREALEARLGTLSAENVSAIVRLAEVNRILDEVALYRVDELALAVLKPEQVRKSSDGFTVTKLEKLYTDVARQSFVGVPPFGFHLCLQQLRYFGDPRIGLVEIIQPSTQQGRERFRITSLGVQYLHHCRNGAYNQALALLPESQLTSEGQLEQDILQKVFGHSGAANYMTTCPATVMRVHLLNSATYGRDLGPRLFRALGALLARKSIVAESTPHRGVVYRLAPVGSRAQGHPPLAQRAPLAAGDTDREVLRSIQLIGGQRGIAIVPAIQRDLRERFEVLSVLTVDELRKVVVHLRTQKLIEATSRRVQDDHGHAPGDEVWQEYKLTAKGKQRLSEP